MKAVLDFLRRIACDVGFHKWRHIGTWVQNDGWRSVTIHGDYWECDLCGAKKETTE